VRLAWETSAEARKEAARFFADVISLDRAYISHGEIQGGLSVDGETWSPDLPSLFAADLQELDASTGLATARNDAGALMGAALVAWVDDERVRFAVLEDLAVTPDQRSHGVGAKLESFVRAEAVRRGCSWVFLESGKDNRRAHAFFERAGYHEVSHVFALRLGGDRAQD
jgi:GNAT superfamily N-acetyltransferase